MLRRLIGAYLVSGLLALQCRFLPVWKQEEVVKTCESEMFKRVHTEIDCRWPFLNQFSVSVLGLASCSGKRLGASFKKGVQNGSNG